MFPEIHILGVYNYLTLFLAQRRTQDASRPHTRWPTRNTDTGANLHTKVLDALTRCFLTHQ